jgi:hypothetical protein
MEDGFYIVVDEDGEPELEEVPSVDGKAAILCMPDLAEDGEKVERSTYSDLAVLLHDRDDIKWLRLRTYEGPKLREKPDFLREALS